MKPLNDSYIQQAISMMPYIPDSTEEVISYFRRNYGLYRYTAWWQHLNDQLIRSNPHAKSWISGKKNSLLIHHVLYKNLFHEKLGQDIFIITYDEHNQAHYYKLLFIFTKKIGMKKRNLLRRLRFLKYNYCIQNGRFVPALWYAVRCMLS